MPEDARQNLLRTIALLARDNGVRDTMKITVEKLSRAVDPLFAYTDTDYAGQNRLIGHFGLSGELWNGLGLYFDYYIRRAYESGDEDALLTRTKDFIRDLARKKSQLSAFRQTDRPEETAREALTRCLHELRLWTGEARKAAENLDPITAAGITKQLEDFALHAGAFQGQLTQFMDFIRQAEAYFNPVPMPFPSSGRNAPAPR